MKRGFAVLSSVLILTLLHGCASAPPRPSSPDNSSDLPANSCENDGTETVDVKILGFNDFHGALESTAISGRPVGGAGVLSSYFKAETDQANGNALIIHAGDQVGASPPVSALQQDEPAIELLNLLANSDCKSSKWLMQHQSANGNCNIVGTLGNHEFDEGVNELLRLIFGGNAEAGPFMQNPWPGAKFPYVNANVVDIESNLPILPPFVIATTGGVKIGVIGAVLAQTPTIVTPGGVTGVRFLDEADSVNQYVKKLKTAGVRTIVLTIHQGAEKTPFNGQTNTEASELEGAIGYIVRALDDEVDLVISGHAHGFTNQLVPNKNGKPILVTQAFHAGTAYADIDLNIDCKTGDVISKTAEIIRTWADQDPALAPNPTVTKLVNNSVVKTKSQVNQLIGQAEKPITRSESPAGESELGNLIADSMRSATGTEIAFINPGGIRKDLDSGEVLFGELFTILPFNNNLMTMSLTGKQILELLAQQWSGANYQDVQILKTSGINYSWNAMRSPEERIETANVFVNGKPLQLDQNYSVTVNNFLASGGDNFTVLKEGRERKVHEMDLDALVNYIQTQPQPFNAKIENRIERSNEK